MKEIKEFFDLSKPLITQVNFGNDNLEKHLEIYKCKAVDTTPNRPLATITYRIEEEELEKATAQYVITKLKMFECGYYEQVEVANFLKEHFNSEFEQLLEKVRRICLTNCDCVRMEGYLDL
jgi:hypothetical protein